MWRKRVAKKDKTRRVRHRRPPCRSSFFPPWRAVSCSGKHGYRIGTRGAERQHALSQRVGRDAAGPAAAGREAERQRGRDTVLPHDDKQRRHSVSRCRSRKRLVPVLEVFRCTEPLFRAPSAQRKQQLFCHKDSSLDTYAQACPNHRHTAVAATAATRPLMLSAHTSYAVNKKSSAFPASTSTSTSHGHSRIHHTGNLSVQDSLLFISESPVTQDSSSMSSVADDYDFRSTDISSSAQTSTNSPIRLPETRTGGPTNTRNPKFSSVSFYSGPAFDGKTNNNKHATQFRRSLVISPSFNSISSSQSAHAETPTDSFNDSRITSTLSDPAEVPTKNIGMVISPSIRALSDILTSKVASQKNTSVYQQAPISEEGDDGNDEDDDDDDDDDNSTILLKSSHRQPSSLIDDIYSPLNQHGATFHKTTSQDTLKINIPAKGNNANSQPNLIDLDTPVVENNNFASASSFKTAKSSLADPNNTNYSDLFESYSPVKGDASYEEKNSTGNADFTAPNTYDQFDKEDKSTTADRRYSNRLSTMSENFDEFQSPALGYNEPVQGFNFINPSINRSFSKLSNISDSFHEIGYGNDNDTYRSGSDVQESAFSFVPSRAGTLTKTRQEDEGHDVPPFTQKNSVRDSIRIVDEDDDSASLVSDGVISPNLNLSSSSTPVLHSSFKFDNDKTPKIEKIPNLGYNHHKGTKSTPQLSASERVRPGSPQRSLFNSPVLLNSSPIRNTSPTFEIFKNSPTEETKRNYINLSSTAQVPKSPKVRSQANKSAVKSPKMALTEEMPKMEKLQPAKPKQKKLTFKSIFSKNHESQSPHTADLKKKSPLLGSDEKFGRPKSFSFNTLGHNNNQGKLEERKEKSKSLLSGWKRKSLGFQNKKEKVKTSNILQNPQNDETSKNNNTHRKSQSNVSLPVLNKAQTPVTRQAPSSPHKHSSSTPAIFTKELPNLPPPGNAKVAVPTPSAANNGNGSLLQTYGFNQASPVFSQTPIISKSPKITTKSQCPPSPTWDNNPEIIRSSSEQAIETATSPMDLPEPQTAKVDQYSPAGFESRSFGGSSPNFERSPQGFSKENSNNYNNESSLAFNSSSTYETTEPEDDTSMAFFKPPKALGITENVGKTSPTSLGVSTFDDNMLRTPPSIASPAFSVVASFTASPNRYHIGDDMFPKKLGVDEIESIVSLERSRSMRSVRSNVASERQRVSHKNSILRMVQDNNDDFNEMLLPDGMVVVKSPLTDQCSLLSKGTEADPVRTASILKNRIGSIAVPARTQPFNNTLKRDSMNFDERSVVNDNVNVNVNANEELNDNDDFNEFIDMINFDDDDDISKLNTSFNVDTSMDLKFSPVRQIQRDSSVPDFLGIDNSFNSIHVGDVTDSRVNTSRGNEGFSAQLTYNAPESTDSIDDIIKEEENLHKNLNYSTQSLKEPYQFQPPSRPVSKFFKGLTGPSFNSTLKPETKSAILGVLAKNQPIHTVVPSDSENSLYNMNYSNNHINDDLNRNRISDKNILTTPKESSYDNYNDYANYYDNSPLQQESPQNSQRYSLNNPFTDYSQSYEDLGTTSPNGSTRFDHVSDTSNRRKSLNLMGKLNTNKFGHFSTSSLPAVLPLQEEEREKPKRLTKKRNRTSVSLGRLGMFDSIIPRNAEIEKPNVKFSSRILLYDTYGEDEYDRKPETSTCNNLTPQLAMDIRNELNELKAEMPIHEESRRYTHFF